MKLHCEMKALAARRCGGLLTSKLTPPTGLLTECRTLEAFEPPTDPRCYNYTPQLAGEVRNPTSLHKAVNDLFTTLKERVAHSERLVTATIVLHRANFGLVVYKHPRPGIVHAYNKKFGDQPLFATTGPDIGVLYSLRDYLYRS